jgi:hypothetical protein
MHGFGAEFGKLLVKVEDTHGARMLGSVAVSAQAALLRKISPG